MKISKLFHLLYAFVMMLPIFAIGGTLLVSTFNMASKQESEIIYKYETNDVSNNDDIIVGRAYYFDINSGDTSDYLTWSQNQNFYFGILTIDSTSFIQSDFVLDEDYLWDIRSNGKFIGAFGTNTIEFYMGEDAYISYEIGQQDFYIRAKVVVLSYDTKSSVAYHAFSKASDLPIESVETHNLSAREVFYNALDDVKESPYFSWAYNSFLASPIIYITGLFSIPSSHVIIELLSYWLAISIIWLVFDLIMYVPLLVHRWIDKGVLE